MAQILDYLVSGSPSLVYNLEANYSRSGAQVIISWNAQFRFPYSNDMLGKGHGLWVRASANGSSSDIELKSTDTNISYYSTGGDWQEEHTSSFSYTNASAHTVTVTFQGIDTTGYNEFSTTVQLSVPGSGPQNVYISSSSTKYFEFMSNSNFSMASWSVSTGQTGDIWTTLGSGSWNRGGLNYSFGSGKTFTQYSDSDLNQIWTTHVYNNSKASYQGSYTYYPRIYIDYNANSGSGAPSRQTKYIGNSLSLSSTKPTRSSVTYNITYNANGGSGAPSSQTFTKTSYVFNGWNTKSNGTGTNINSGATLTYQQWNSVENAWSSNSGWQQYTPSDRNGNVITLYAKWTTNNYNWTCPATRPTRSGYEFLGWSTSSSATTATYTPGNTYSITGNLALYAVWSGTNLSFEICEGQRDRFYIKIATSITNISNVSVRVHNNADGSSTTNDIITSFGTSKEGCANAGGPRRTCTITVTVTGSSTKSVSMVHSTESYVPGEVLLTHSSKNISATSVGFTISGLIDNSDINHGDFNVYIVPKQTNYIADAPTMYFAGVLWQRVLKQNIKEGTVLFTTASGAIDSGQYGTDDKHSYMSRLNDNLKINNKYQFLLIYPNQYNWRTIFNSWRQSLNPINEVSQSKSQADGYEAVNVSWTSGFGGMGRQNSDSTVITNCYLTGNFNTSNWFYALASSIKWSDRYPIPSVSGTGTWGSAELWVRVPGSVTPIIKPISYDGITKDITINGLEPNTEYMAFAELVDSTDDTKILNNYSKLVSFKTNSLTAKLRYKREINLNTYIPKSSSLQPVQSVRTTGTQHFYTPYIASTDTSIFVDFQFTDVSTKQQRLFGAQTDNSSYISFSFYINGNGNWAYAYNSGTGNWVSTGIPADTNRHTLYFNKDGRVMLDQGMLYNEPIQGNFTSHTTKNEIVIGACDIDAEIITISNFSNVMIYQFNIYEGDKLVANYMPYKQNNSPVLYDTLSQESLTGIGSGIVAGQNNDITFHDYVNLENLSGAQKAYFNTGYIPNYNSKFIVKYRNTEHEIDTPLFGARRDWSGSAFANQYTLWAHPIEFGGGHSIAVFNELSRTLPSYAENTDVLFSMCYRDSRINGSVFAWNPNFGSPNVQLPIGALNTENVIDSRTFIGRIYYFIIYENNKIKHYYIPFRGTASKLGFGDANMGLYDIITREFLPLYEADYGVGVGPEVTDASKFPIWEENNIKLKNTTWKTGLKVKFKINDTWIDASIS